MENNRKLEHFPLPKTYNPIPRLNLSYKYNPQHTVPNSHSKKLDQFDYSQFLDYEKKNWERKWALKMKRSRYLQKETIPNPRRIFTRPEEISSFIKMLTKLHPLESYEKPYFMIFNQDDKPLWLGVESSNARDPRPWKVQIDNKILDLSNPIEMIHVWDEYADNTDDAAFKQLLEVFSNEPIPYKDRLYSYYWSDTKNS